MEEPEPFFISDTTYDSLEKTILEQVRPFYKEISSLICAYKHCRLQLGQLLDVYDESCNWIIGCVVALRRDYVGIHYNGHACNYDDWIHCESFRLAPLHSYDYHKFYSDYLSCSQQYNWGKTVYNAFLASISPGYGDRMKPVDLVEYISNYTWTKYDPTKTKEQNLVEALIALHSYSQSLFVRLHATLLEWQYRDNPDTYQPFFALPCDRASLEEQSRSYRGQS